MSIPASCRLQAVALHLLITSALLSCDSSTDDRPSPPLDLEGQPVDILAAGDSRAVVLLFARSDCPIANRYAPEIKRIHEEFSPRGVRFWLVYPDPDETPAGIRKHLADYDFGPEPLRDPDHVLVALTGVRVTPEAAVFIPDGTLVYRGRIDDIYVDFGQRRAEPSSRDLQRVLQAVLEGSAVEPTTTSAVGCPISDLK